MENEFISKDYKEIRARGHFTIIDDGSVQEWLSKRLLELNLNNTIMETTKLTEWDMVTGDCVRDYDNISPQLWLDLYGDDEEPDIDGLEWEVK